MRDLVVKDQTPPYIARQVGYSRVTALVLHQRETLFWRGVSFDAVTSV